MATKKTDKKSSAKGKARAAAPKKAKAKKATVSTADRHPKARLAKAHGSKADLAKALAPALARGGEDAGDLATRLGKASNQQLLRLQRVVDAVNKQYGSRDKLIEAIGTAQKKSKDQAFLTRLASFSLPRLLDLAKSAGRRARA